MDDENLNLSVKGKIVCWVRWADFDVYFRLWTMSCWKIRSRETAHESSGFVWARHLLVSLVPPWSTRCWSLCQVPILAVASFSVVLKTKLSFLFTLIEFLPVSPDIEIIWWKWYDSHESHRIYVSLPRRRFLSVKMLWITRKSSDLRVSTDIEFISWQRCQSLYTSKSFGE